METFSYNCPKCEQKGVNFTIVKVERLPEIGDTRAGYSLYREVVFALCTNCGDPVFIIFCAEYTPELLGKWRENTNLLDLEHEIESMDGLPFFFYIVPKGEPNIELPCDMPQEISGIYYSMCVLANDGPKYAAGAIQLARSIMDHAFRFKIKEFLETHEKANEMRNYFYKKWKEEHISDDELLDSHHTKLGKMIHAAATFGIITESLKETADKLGLTGNTATHNCQRIEGSEVEKMQLVKSHIKLTNKFLSLLLNIPKSSNEYA